MTTHTIDPSSDVTLVVKNPNASFAPLPGTAAAPPRAPADASQSTTERGGNSEIRIKVSSKHLTMASPVFERALNGSWKESLDFKRDGIVEIRAEGWDIEALLVFMKMVHSKPHDLPAQPSVELIAKLGVLADYYQCIPLAGYYAMKWIAADVLPPAPFTVDDVYIRDLVLRVWISWAFNSPNAFEASCQMLVQTSRGSICSFGLPIPANIIESLNKRREAAIEKAKAFIERRRHSLLTNESPCTVACRAMTLGTLLIFLQKCQILSTQAPYSGVVLSDLASWFQSIKCPNWNFCQSKDYFLRKGHECAHSSFSRMFRSMGCSVGGFNINDFKP